MKKNLSAALFLLLPALCGAADVTVTIDYSSPTVISAFSPGLDQTNYQLCFPWTGNDLTAVNNVKALIRDGITFVNQHIMAWGVGDPWPDPAQPKDFTYLDRQMQQILDTGATPVITLCEAPWWMKGHLASGGITQLLAAADEWASIAYDARVLDNKMDQWLELVQAVAERYMAAPYNVRHFMVWNEFKGYYNPTTNNWDSGVSPGDPSGDNAKHGYTYMYNCVYQRIKQTAVSMGISPDTVKIGGPYIGMGCGESATAMSHPSSVTGPWGVMDRRSLDAVSCWLQNKTGAEMLVVDGANRVSFGSNPADDFGMTQKFAAANDWMRRQPGAETLPIWWAEWYVAPQQLPETDDINNALGAYGLVQQVTSGGSAVFLWGTGVPGGASDPPLWTETAAGGGQPKPWYFTYKAFKDHFPPGTQFYAVQSSSSSVAALASAGKTMLINTTASPLTLSVNGVAVTLHDYEVKFIDRAVPASPRNLRLRE